MININVNLVGDVKFSTSMKDDEKVKIANFSLVKKYRKDKEYTNCSVYGDRIEIVKDFEKGDFINGFGYFKECTKDSKTYKNFIVKSLNKIEKKKKKTKRTNDMDFSTQEIDALKVFVMGIVTDTGTKKKV